MHRVRTPRHFWALLVGICTLLLLAALCFFSPGRTTENYSDANSPVTIMFSIAPDSGLLRLDIPRDADPKLVQSINLNHEVRMWMPQGAVLHHEGPKEHDGTTP